MSERGVTWEAVDLHGFAPCSGCLTPVRFVAQVPSPSDEPAILCMACLNAMAEELGAIAGAVVLGVDPPE